MRYPPVLDSALDRAAAGLEAVMKDLAGVQNRLSYEKSEGNNGIQDIPHDLPVTTHPLQLERRAKENLVDTMFHGTIEQTDEQRDALHENRHGGLGHNNKEDSASTDGESLPGIDSGEIEGL